MMDDIKGVIVTLLIAIVVSYIVTGLIIAALILVGAMTFKDIDTIGNMIGFVVGIVVTMFIFDVRYG